MTGRYRTGWLPIADTCWKVMTVKGNRTVKLGEICVSGKKVGREMDVHRSIKGYEPKDLARKMASRKFPKKYFYLKEIACKKR